MELMRWELADRFHWTLDVIDALPLGDLHDLIQIDDARAKIREQHGTKSR